MTIKMLALTLYQMRQEKFINIKFTHWLMRFITDGFLFFRRKWNFSPAMLIALY